MGGRIYTIRRKIIPATKFGVFADLDGDSQYFYRTDADFPESGITGANDLTIQLWVNPNDITGEKGLVSKYQRLDDKRMYLLEQLDDELDFYISDDGTFNPGASNALSTTVGLQIGIWSHIAVVYDASEGTVDIYKDGSFLEQGVGMKNSIADKDPPFRIGNYKDLLFFDGGIFNVALFDDKRTAAEILASANDWNIDLSGEGNIIGQWMFDEAAVAAAIDNTQGDAGRDLIPYDGGDVTFGNCGRTIGMIPLYN